MLTKSENRRANSEEGPTSLFAFRSSLFFVVALGSLTPRPSLAQAVDPDLQQSIRWYTGVAGRVDNAKAKGLLLRAASDSDVVSQMWVARVYSRGRMGFEHDSVLAREIAARVIDQVESLAESGVVEAVFLMGTAFDEGLGRATNIETAVRWYRQAADMGNVLAKHNLGNLYFAGRGVPQSDSLAVSWWLEAATLGDAIPQFRLGTMYQEGRGVSPDLGEARRWYEESAGRGNQAAREALAKLSGP